MIGIITLLVYRDSPHYYETLETRYRKMAKRNEKDIDRNTKKPNQFFTLCREYLKAAKDKVCPIIEFE